MREREAEKMFDPRRRRLLLWIPATLFSGVAATLAAAAFRFLRPRADGPGAGEINTGAWAPLAPVSALAGEVPMLRKVVVEKRAGWSVEREERAVYVLPKSEHQVVSAVCPHEQCEVAWSDETREFLCPCHDSRFDAGGARLTGPAARDLDRLPSRVEEGVLQIRFDIPGHNS